MRHSNPLDSLAAKGIEIAMWLKAVLLIVIALLIVGAGAIAYGASRWKAGTNELRAKLEAARLPIRPITYDAREIESLPLPVRRYFRTVLKDGQPICPWRGSRTKDSSTWARRSRNGAGSHPPR